MHQNIHLIYYSLVFHHKEIYVSFYDEKNEYYHINHYIPVRSTVSYFLLFLKFVLFLLERLLTHHLVLDIVVDVVYAYHLILIQNHMIS